MTYTTKRQIRKAFWDAHKGTPGITPRRITNYSGKGKMHNTDTRCAFCDFVDMLRKNGEISSELADRITLKE